MNGCKEQTREAQQRYADQASFTAATQKVDLRDAAGISSNSLAKLGKNESVRMDVLMKVATVLNCKMEDLFETVQDDE